MTIPKYFYSDRKQKKSKKQEKRLADKLGGKRQKGSGSQPYSKGDVRCTDLLAEAKRTDKKSISIKVQYLEKIVKEATSYDCIPAVAIAFEDTPLLVPKDWVLVPAEFLRELLDFYREQGGGDREA
jgi:hypothetical protein